ncbi:flagellar basal body-associated FliL family protein [Tropicimonas sp. IMCC6043]|uniref:flagellar basal body-associated FliL family protein n=1 Tax=Tropicimonas sp. IMCC6043 TaxID=2510645 RepID=UPI00101C2BC1|nr:flagellar basal body-associated FliL family protein [Tropicimonas sp. IMCC6043]RYH07484.1 flagellar basal body-associated FliL family protein [Tropicimonas sp. IMCC6043]
MRLIFPIVLAMAGAGAGLGAGIILRPGAEATGEQAAGSAEQLDGHDASRTELAWQDADPIVASTNDPLAAGTPDPHAPAVSDTEFTKLNNQFVVPVLRDGQVRSMVILSLSLETPVGRRERIFDREPRIRDTFLQVLFDHANAGGFDGDFTNGDRMDVLRGELRRSARQLLGPDVYDILVTDIARQDLG